jgi:uncharacterized damage-inducible protein DinB
LILISATQTTPEENHMPDLSQTVSTGFASYYEKLRINLHTWVASLTEDQFWKNPFSYGNSVGHLVLHLTGNLNYYIGTQIAESGYVRDRPREFAETKTSSKQEALDNFDKAIEIVKATIQKQSAEDWSTPYTATGVTCENRFAILLDCAAHADHHIGQILNLARELVR